MEFTLNQAVLFAQQDETTFNEYKEELFEKYEVQGQKALFALALSFRNTSRLWEVESAFVELLPLFTDRPPTISAD